MRGVRGESGSSHTGDEGQGSRPPPLPSGPVSLFCRVASQPQLMWYVGLPTAVLEAVRPHRARGPVSAQRPRIYVRTEPEVLCLCTFPCPVYAQRPRFCVYAKPQALCPGRIRGSVSTQSTDPCPRKARSLVSAQSPGFSVRQGFQPWFQQIRFSCSLRFCLMLWSIMSSSLLRFSPYI